MGEAKPLIFDSLENFDLALERISRSLRLEVKDRLGLEVYDWASHKPKHLEMLIGSIKSGIYQPQEVSVIRKPKPDRSFREFEFLSMDDRIVYQAIGNKLAELSYNKIIKLFQKKRIFANMPTLPSKKSPYLLKQPFTRTYGNFSFSIGQYNLFRQEIYNCREIILEYCVSPWIIKTDITAYYSSIDHSILLDILQKEEWLSDQESRLLKECLACWFKDKEGKGIPIGYETSDYISNLYLNSVDNALEKAKLIARRYVDDIYIFVENFEEAKQAIAILDAELSKLKLTRNSSKTKFICLKNNDEILDELLGEELYFDDLVENKEGDEININEQKKLLEMLKYSIDLSKYNDCQCNISAIKNIRRVARILYRLRIIDPIARNIAICILDIFPNYSLQSTTYLQRNYAWDDEVKEKLFTCAKNKIEPTQLRLDCIKALQEMIGYRGIEDLINTLILEEDDWSFQYLVLRDISAKNSVAIKADYLYKFIINNKINYLVFSMALYIEFVRNQDKEYRTELVNVAFQHSNEFVRKLGIYFTDKYKLQPSGLGLLDDNVREIFLVPDMLEKFPSFGIMFQNLFSLPLDDVSLPKLFRDSSKAIHSLWLITNKVKPNEHTDELQKLVKNFLSLKIDPMIIWFEIDLEDFLDEYFPDLSVTLAFLVTQYSKLKRGDYVKHSDSNRLTEIVANFFRSQLNNLSPKGIQMVDPQLAAIAIPFLIEIGRWAKTELSERWKLQRNDKEIDLSEKAQVEANASILLNDVNIGHDEFEKAMELIKKKRDIIYNLERAIVSDQQERLRGEIPESMLEARKEHHQERIKSTREEIKKHLESLGDLTVEKSTN